ncbi:hypothetical protein Kisp01_35900 [Kineosporia sp. NBRC 101677]|nr:hypothetical protein Kisp01_35900 [Kineosporia sp. NBRC 101677]
MVEGGREDRAGGVQVTGHTGALGALAGEQESDPAAATGAGDDALGRPEVGERLQAGHQFGGGAAEHGGAVFVGGAVVHQRPGDVALVQFRAGGHVVQQAPGLGGESGRRAARDQPDAGGVLQHTRGRSRRRSGLLAFVLGEGGRFLDDDVGVGAADAEGGDARAAGPADGGRPLLRLGQQPDPARVPVHVRRGLTGVQGGRQQTVLHGQDHLHDTRGTGRGLGVGQVGLHRAEPQRLVVWASLTVGGQQGLGLDRVAQHGAGAVRLDRVHVGGGEPGRGQGLADHPLLGGTVGGGQAVGGAVLVHRRAGHDRQHPVTVAAGVGQALQHDHAGALTPAGAVGVGRERLAPPVTGQPLLQGEPGERDRRRHHGDSAGQGQVALAAAQGLGGQVQGDQRGGTGGVDGDGGPFQPEDVRDAAGEHGTGGAGEQEPFRAAALEPAAVTQGRAAGEDAGAAAAQRAGLDARVLQRLPRGLQQQALLRVHGQRLARADAEEAGVELGRVVEEPALLGRLGLHSPVAPAAVGREPGHRVRS